MLTKEQTELVQQNTGLIRDVVNKYYHYAQTYTYEDLMQCGYLGLIRAAEAYDESKGVKFASHAWALIRYAVLDALRKTDRIVHVPEYLIPHIKRFREEHRESGIHIKEYARRNGISLEHFRQALYASRQILYLDEPAVYSEDEYTTLMDLLTDNRNDTEGTVQCQEVREKLEQEFQFLKNNGTSEKHISMLKSYYGIGKEPSSFQEIGKEYGLSQMRISQIVRKLERKMRYHLRYEKELVETFEEFDMHDYE